jgi:hypothetical protein
MKIRTSRNMLTFLLLAFLSVTFCSIVATKGAKVTASVSSSVSEASMVPKRMVRAFDTDEGFQRRRLQLLPIGGGNKNPTYPSAAPFIPPSSATAPPSPVAPVSAPSAQPYAQTQQPQPPVSNPTMRPSSAPVEPPNTFPVMRLVVTYVATQLHANPLTDQILQIIANSVLITTFPTPQLVTITGYVPILDGVLARRRNLVNTQCADGKECDLEDNGGSDVPMYNYTITCACDYMYPVSDTLALLNEATASILNAVETGQLSDEIQSEADQTGVAACQKTQMIKATVDCVTCSQDTVEAVNNMLSDGEIAGICVGAVVFTSILFAFIAVYYNPHLLKGLSSSSNDNNEAGSGGGDNESGENPSVDVESGDVPVTSCN